MLRGRLDVSTVRSLSRSLHHHERTEKRSNFSIQPVYNVWTIAVSYGSQNKINPRCLLVVSLAWRFDLFRICEPSLGCRGRYEAQDAVESKSSQLRHFFKRSIILLRTLYSFVRLLPAYSVSRQEQKIGIGGHGCDRMAACVVLCCLHKY